MEGKKSEVQLADEMEQEPKEILETYDKLFEELEEGGYFNMTYGKDSEVTIPGSLFNSFIFYIHSQSKNIASTRNVISVLDQTLKGLQVNTADMTVRLMKQHKTNVDNGWAISQEEMDKEDAQEEIKELEKKPSRKKKEKVKG